MPHNTRHILIIRRSILKFFDVIRYIASAILLGLYLSERFGTHRLGSVFGGFMLIWFLLIGIYGIIQIVQEPKVLKALSPSYGFARILVTVLLYTIFFYTFKDIGYRGWHGVVFLGIVVLAVTGVEALYADLGHFGARPIRMSWLGIVYPLAKKKNEHAFHRLFSFTFSYPTLVLNYFGQGALLLRDPLKTSNPFFYSVPNGMLYPTLVIATIATIIASQAVISGNSFFLVFCILRFI
jgi:KUP system potassium uptake protein